PASVRRPARPPRGGFGPVDDRSADDGFGLRPDQAGVDLLGPVGGDEAGWPATAVRRRAGSAAGCPRRPGPGSAPRTSAPWWTGAAARRTAGGTRSARRRRRG